jgi:hypothetical protein
MIKNPYRIQGLWYNPSMRKSQGFQRAILYTLAVFVLIGCSAKGRAWDVGGAGDGQAPIAGTEHVSPIPKARGDYDSPEARDMVIRHKISLPPL